MYTESEFMDMSLASRLDKLNSEVQKILDWLKMRERQWKRVFEFDYILFCLII